MIEQNLSAFVIFLTGAVGLILYGLFGLSGTNTLLLLILWRITDIWVVMEQKRE